MFFPHQGPWTNWIDDYAADGVLACRPRTAGELVAIVEYAVTEGKRIRAVGAAHSTTSVARPDDILVLPDNLHGKLEIDFLRSSWERKRGDLVRLKAGTRLKAANRDLLGDKAVLNMGSFDWQTMIGAISTGTHGSGIGLGPMAESVRSIEMVTVREVDGQPDIGLRRIEPAEGITDADAFNRPGRALDIELIQDDDTFYSAVVSFACIGLVYSLTLEVRDAYWLDEENELKPWSEVERMLEAGPHPRFDYELPRVLAENRHWEFLVNCAEVQGKKATEDPTCFVRERNMLGEEPRKPADWNDKKHDWPPRRVPDCWTRDLAEDYARPGIDRRKGKGIGYLTKNALQKDASRPPFEGDFHCSRNYWVLRRERDDTRLPDEEPEPPPDAISNEIAVPLENTVAAVRRILDLMAENEYFYPVPFGVRFVGPSQHYLAPQYGRPTCMIEIPLVLPNKSKKRQREMVEFKEALGRIERSLCYGGGHLGGRPHWGQYNELDRERLEELYDRLPEFERTYSTHNAFGTFDNDYTRQIGLRRVRVDEPEAEEPDLTALRVAADHLL